MQGGLLKSASAVAIIAAAGLFGASPAKAADLGGDCCADLEERVAELEATTVRKGNRKVSLTISGHVSYAVLAWNDGTQKDVYFGDPGNGTSRFRFVGTAKISPQLTAGFLYEMQATSNSLGNSTNQLNGGDRLGNTGAPQSSSLGGTAYAGCGAAVGANTISATNSQGCASLRDQTVWLKHSQLGMIKIGHGSTSTDNLTLIDVGRIGVIGTSDVGLHIGGFILRGKNGLLGNATTLNWTAAIRGHESFDTFRRDHVLYETPTLFGFTLQAAVANDNFWDVALRYSGEFGGFRLAGGIGYQQDSGFNGPFQNLSQVGSLCGAQGAASTNCDVKTKELKGSASVLHVPTGLFVTTALAKRELGGNSNNISGVAGGNANTSTAYTGPDATMFWIASGVSKNFFGIGNTVLFGEYGEHKGGLAQNAFLGGNSQSLAFATCINGTPTSGATSCNSKVTQWGVALVQYIDAAAMELYVGYKNYSLQSEGFIGTNVSLNKSQGGVNDISAVMAGTKINF